MMADFREFDRATQMLEALSVPGTDWAPIPPDSAARIGSIFAEAEGFQKGIIYADRESSDPERPSAWERINA